MTNLKQFLKESNAIEGVRDADSYFQALRAWDYLIEQDRINSMVIKKTHYLLMKDKLPEEKIGYYRQIEVMVGGRICKPWRDLTILMHNWCRTVNINIKTRTPSWKQKHVAYEKIHPFVDGNGRTGRMFMNWQRLMIGMDILVIKESEKQAYYDWFKT